ncbi:MAG: glycosyltransferase [Desulfobacterales bacterium]
MKIVYLSSSTIPSRTANSIHVMKMCQAFVKNGHEVALMASPGQESQSDIWSAYAVDQCFSIKYIKRPNWGRFGSLVYGEHVARKVSQARPDLVYGRCPHSLALASRLNIPFIYEAHDLPKNFFRKRVEHFLFSRKNFRSLVVITEALKKAYLKNFSELKDVMVLVAHDGADIMDQTVLPRPTSISDPMKVGYAGSLYPGKGMEIIAELSKVATEYEYHIVGGNGPLEKWSNTLGENVIFHGHVSPSQVYLYLIEFDVLLLPLLRKVQTSGGGDIGKYTSPMKLFEYMTAKRPIVASKLPVLEEVLENGKTALLANPDKIYDWKNSLDRLNDDDQLRKLLAENAFKELRNRYTWLGRSKAVLNQL